MIERFSGQFTQQEPIPEDAVDAAVAVLKTGRLHRYNVAEGELGEVGRVKGELVGHNPIEDDAQGPDVRLVRVVVPMDYLR